MGKKTTDQEGLDETETFPNEIDPCYDPTAVIVILLTLCLFV